MALANGSSTLDKLSVLLRPTTTASERILSVHSSLSGLLPLGGLRRGTVAELNHVGLLFVAMRDAMAQGSWAAIVGAPNIGLAAADDHGLALERLAIVSTPPIDQAATVVAALIDAVDLVVVGPGVITRAADARRLGSRLRERNGVLFALGPWPDAVETRIEVLGASWVGAEFGHGHLQGWDADVRVTGRGASARERRATVTLVAAPNHEFWVEDASGMVTQATVESVCAEAVNVEPAMIELVG